MELSIISIGNSKGIRLSKTILDTYNIGTTVELVMEKDGFKIKPKQEPRKGWAIAFKKMHSNGDDALLINDVFTDENFDEWK